jgi:hypothetical protein
VKSELTPDDHLDVENDIEIMEKYQEIQEMLINKLRGINDVSGVNTLTKNTKGQLDSVKMSLSSVKGKDTDQTVEVNQVGRCLGVFLRTMFEACGFLGPELITDMLNYDVPLQRWLEEAQAVIDGIIRNKRKQKDYIYEGIIVTNKHDMPPPPTVDSVRAQKLYELEFQLEKSDGMYMKEKLRYVRSAATKVELLELDVAFQEEKLSIKTDFDSMINAHLITQRNIYNNLLKKLSSKTTRSIKKEKSLTDKMKLVALYEGIQLTFGLFVSKILTCLDTVNSGTSHGILMIVKSVLNKRGTILTTKRNFLTPLASRDIFGIWANYVKGYMTPTVANYIDFYTRRSQSYTGDFKKGIELDSHFEQEAQIMGYNAMPRELELIQSFLSNIEDYELKMEGFKYLSILVAPLESVKPSEIPRMLESLKLKTTIQEILQYYEKQSD